ncbi:hypothetical protein TNCV_4038931 [Trichonephila clavipes]|nr:hypothetical protein TNCV_4038931 [Trichonephila clavipes]
MIFIKADSRSRRDPVPRSEPMPLRRSWSSRTRGWRCRVLVLLTNHMEGLVHVKSVEAECSPVGVMWQFKRGANCEMSSSSLNGGSKLRGSSPVPLVLIQSAM